MATSVKGSLRDRLLAATTFDELELIRKEQRKYNNAKTNTRTKWRRAYNLRFSQLEAELSEEQRNAEREKRKALKAEKSAV